MSGIYIPGMGIPTSCYKCNLKKIWEDGVQCLVNKGLWMDGDSKHKACPLIPVPPHGRLIDADSLEETFCGNCFADEKPMECSEPCMDMRIILDAPTIIPADKEAQDG